MTQNWPVSQHWKDKFATCFDKGALNKPINNGPTTVKPFHSKKNWHVYVKQHGKINKKKEKFKNEFDINKK